MSLRRFLLHRAQGLGFSRVGIASVEPFDDLRIRWSTWLEEGGARHLPYLNHPDRLDPRHVFPEAQSALVGFFPYARPHAIPGQEPNSARLSRYLWGPDYHRMLKSRLGQLLQEGQALASDLKGRACVDTAPLMERQLAVRAGLGWQGRHTLLIAGKDGSWGFLGVLLLNAKLATNTPFEGHRCGTCQACLKACPTGALQPFRLDPNRCLSTYTLETEAEPPQEVREALIRTRWIAGCDACQEACPWNRAPAWGDPNVWGGASPLHTLPLEALSLNTSQYRKHTASTALRRVRHRAWLQKVGWLQEGTRSGASYAGTDRVLFSGKAVMDLARFPRRSYTPGPTPLERLDRFSEALGGPTVYIKRDDQLGLTGQGNKTRKLEFLVADALSQGADTLITCGGVQSNHCRLTLAAAVKEGLQCRLILAESAPGAYQPDGGGNVLLYHLLGPERISTIPWGTDLLAALAEAGEKAKAEGRRPYLIPLGGSSPLGAVGYTTCVDEILAQEQALGLRFRHLVVAMGSGGTQAGLLLGLRAAGCRTPVAGISVLNPQPRAEEIVYGLTQSAAALLGQSPCVTRDDVSCTDAYLGEGYTIPTPAMVEAVKLLARTEGILVDPTYSGKALSGLIGLARAGHFQKGEPVLFVHTGGVPGLYARPGLFPAGI